MDHVDEGFKTKFTHTTGIITKFHVVLNCSAGDVDSQLGTE
jgi:hypothetical protein